MASTCLEIVCTLTAYREFESPPLRQISRGYWKTVTPFSFGEPSLSAILFVTDLKIAIPPAPEAPAACSPSVTTESPRAWGKLPNYKSLPKTDASQSTINLRQMRSHKECYPCALPSNKYPRQGV